ncbi:Protein of unknown function DUF858, methyltransferase-like [Penicillium roqueforti FM164]|uniref:Alpha N-terminal protein methyltransferase 1 n=2 Tax=Penicillium TaxID=5073 RepID=W6PQR0_PENRF|nr:Protein of unknown function DUF858, methyltransferase-like [Penicillium roqueforti FM164]
MLAMLGKFPWYTRIELRGSKNFLSKIRRSFTPLPDKRKFGLGVYCGAGVGRVTKGFLGDVCEMVDIVEPVESSHRVSRKESWDSGV